MKTTIKKLTILAISAILTLGSIIPASAAVVEYGEELTNAPDKSNYSQQFTDVPKSYYYDDIHYAMRVIERND